MNPTDYPTVFLTNEQVQRLAALSLDALTGVQFRTDDSDQTNVNCQYVPIDSPSELEFAEIYPDGSWVRRT